MRLPNVDPKDMRAGDRVILWKYIDPWLALVKRSGDLSQLAERLQIAVGSLRKRRQKLGLEPIKAGRPRVTKLSPKQHHVVQRLSEGKTVTEIATESGATPQQVSSARVKAEAKAMPERRECTKCGGQGVVVCGSTDDLKTYPIQGDLPRAVSYETGAYARPQFACLGQGSHHHMCDACMGDGYLGEV